MKIVFINKRFSPQRSATGYHAHQLAQYLHAQGHIVSLVHTTQNKSKPTIEDDGLKRIGVGSLYFGKQLVLRFLGDLVDSVRLLYRAKKLNADRYIVLSDPPFLHYVSSYFLKPQNSIFWFMDVYPQAFVAHKLVKPSNWFYLNYVNRLRHWRPRLVISLGHNQSRFLKKAFDYNEIISIPIGLQKKTEKQATDHPEWYDKSHLIYFLYKGNLGSAHDLTFLIRLTKSLDKSKHRFIICTSGVKSKNLFNQVKDYSCVVLSDEIKDQDFQFIDIHIVSLLSQWTHICIPSKALLASSTNGTVLFQGATESDTWTYIKEIGWHISDKYQETEEIKDFLSSITKETIQRKKMKSLDVYDKLSKDLFKGYQQIELQMK